MSGSEEIVDTLDSVAAATHLLSLESVSHVDTTAEGAAAHQPVVPQSTSPGSRADPDKLHQIREEFLWSWKAYTDYAWGKDELLPVSKTSHRWFGIGLTLLDTLDMLAIMELDDEPEKATCWVEKASSPLEAKR